MFMVVYGHVVCWRPGFSISEMPSFAENFIIAVNMVNMPLFFMISGYFSQRLHESRDWTRLSNRLISYAWPMAFFAIFLATLEGLVLGRMPILQIPILALKKFLFTNWFFYALASCDIITFWL